jgi:hypothetical protein
MKNLNPNYQRLTVYLNNPEKKKEFKTTYTYKSKPNSTPITNISEAISTAYIMHSDGLEPMESFAKRVHKIVFNGKEVQLFHDTNSHTDNGWIVK